MEHIIITMLTDTYKKITGSTLIIFIVLAVFTTSFAYKPKTAFALLGSAGVLTNPIDLALKETALDRIGWMLANAVLSQISASIVNWINSGFDGSPAFVTDFKRFLTDIADEELGKLIEEDLPLLCESFSFKVKFSLALQTPFKDKISCTLTDVVGNVDSFISGNFNEGGWKGWFELTTKKRNNSYGAYLLATAELDSRIAGKQAIELFKVDQGDGFLSLKTCIVQDSDGKCLQSQITLPGKVIEAQLNNTLAGGQQRLNVADEFDEIVVALFAQLVQQVLFDGLLGGGTAEYVDDLGGQGDSVAFERIRDDVLEEADRIMDSEEIYKITKEETLNMVLQEELQLLLLKNCYEKRRGGSPTSVNTTIENIIDPLKKSLGINIASAQLVIDELNLIKIEIVNASLLNELTDLVFKLRDVDLHSLGDAQSQQREISTQFYGNDFNTFGLNTQKNITDCQNSDN